ncbi:putative 50s ribosomal protein mrp49 protein [Daldinia childiae]|uniref:putative 50s ribosomal protein mrp49 protein n=1 Tax=Daldinia childiae TaxID=326645 RepID=UPI001447A069|nr:putative 50s ribosomal protein mrp49 protein [Daldinia childiae]KAF3071010.1 putative 50s ribosomal protein mrp49 protein [Daldinia childiae]
MVNPGKRMHILQALLALRHGPGAAILPPEITRIHLDFALKWNDGHLGPRKFWKTCLPRLKFWNPAIPMLVNRTSDQSAPAKMSIYFRQASLDSNTPSALTTKLTPSTRARGRRERVVTIDMKNVHSDEILSEFMTKTGATLIHPTPDEQVEMRQIEELNEKAAIDRSIMKKYIDDVKREERILAIARQEADAIKMAND